ncbi:MAG TPA: VWA domain-containing protein [Thermoanaerobaculia bacterium]|jgi:VWFA-related protein|nr:VWA domain-containing protein [Thermoanaerobaculia bacterium]
MLRKYIATAMLALAFAPVAVLAQNNEQQPPRQEGFGSEITVNEVLLDVLVTDKKGNVIVGLTPQDFVVKEDGKPVDLTGVTFYSNRRLVGSAKEGVAVDKVPEDRYFILFFDDQKDAATEAPELLGRQVEAGQRARDWVLKERQPADWVAVVSYDTRLKVQQDFTRDGRALADAVGAAVKGKDSEGNWPSRIKEGEGPSLYAALPKGNELRDKTTTIYDAMSVLARAAGNIHARKNLVMFSTGFGRVNNFNQYIPDPRYYPGMADALNDSNVAVYTIDLAPTGTIHPLASSINQLASDTGGQYYATFNSFSTPLKQIAEENSGYYLLSYRSEQPAGKTGFQPVQVTTTNPEFKVRARKGYAFGDESLQPGR